VTGARKVVVVQARMGSRRLPGKVLADVGGRSMLARVVRRAGRASRVDALVVATTDQPGDDAIVAECERLKVAVFRGDEDDVLDRYHGAAAAHDAAVVVRVTADCPFIAPDVLDLVLAARERAGSDYASNTLRRTYPRGLDTEVMTSEALGRACRDAGKPHQRAHVTPYLYENPALFRLVSVENARDLSGHRWTVDTAEDLALARALYARVGNDDEVAWEKLAAIVEAEPALASLNRGVTQKGVAEC
jgi:spore coat polysaccharide biosynthesis protein SpsF